MAGRHLWHSCYARVTVRSVATQWWIILLFRRRRNIQCVCVVGLGGPPDYDYQTARQSQSLHTVPIFIFFNNLRHALLWVGWHKKLVGFQWPTHPSTNYKISAGKLSIGPTEVLALPLWVVVEMKRPLLTTLFFFLSSSESLLFYQTGCSRVPKLLGFYVLGEIFEV